MDAQLRWTDYFSRSTGVSAQFHLIRKSLGSLGSDPQAMATRLARDPALRLDFSGERGPHDLAQAFRRFLPRLDQSALILTVALFEVFLKDAHRIVLRSDPKLLKGLRPQREVRLERLVDAGGDTVIAEEIESEVASLDRKSVPKRADYFRDRLQAPWGPDELIVEIDRAVDLRNRILHEEPDADVSQEDQDVASTASLFVPCKVCIALVERYPKAFSERDREDLKERALTWDSAYEGWRRYRAL